MKNKVIKIIKNPKLAFMSILLTILNFRVFKILSDETYLKIKYRVIFGKKLHLDKPQTFNEKIQYLKINNDNYLYSKLVDKYEVRKYVKDRIGDEYLVNLYGVYEDFEEIDFEKLPNRFVLKPNHTSGDVYICLDKKLIDFKSLKKIVDKWMEKDYYWLHREACYKNIDKKIICEEFLEDNIEPDLKDYKLLCFNGKVKCSFVGLNRHSVDGLNINFYDLEWNLLPFERHYPKSDVHVSMPKNYNKMLELAEKLARDIPFVRVDFYECNEKIYFGELTFYPGSGFEKFTPEKYDYELGSWLQH